MSAPRSALADTSTKPFAPVRLSEVIGSRQNNFDLLRLLAAWAVLVSHSFAVLDRPEPLHQLGSTLGNVGVLIFFAVSGLLIRRSWEYDPSPRDFWLKRGLRLLPALATVAVLTAFVLGPLITTSSPSAYFSSWQTWIYPVRLVLMFPFGAGLPGVFEDNPLAGAVNGPLWSLPVEVFAYAVLAVLGMVGWLRHPRLVLVLAVLAIAWGAVWVPLTPDAIGSAYVLAAFALGSAAYSFRDRIVLSWPVALGLVVLCYAAGLGPTSVRVVVWTIAGVYLSYWFAYALPPVGRVVTRFGDASYGVYIWAFPVQQTIVQVGGDDLSPWTVIAIATPVVYVLAQLSWHLVEAPALRHKPRRAAPVTPVGPVGPVNP
jgi:peptidoglycan/LPS O-acetylase OafA/YrhL